MQKQSLEYSKTMDEREKDSERVKELRKEFLSFQKRLKTEEIVCLDETGFKLNMTSVYGWAAKEENFNQWCKASG